ncbi:Lrp/AsnC ligand binding domain-containing protein [Bradyrhizobium sp.]|uniref:Lrp/AsnC ligand binding domain-containing protein n=1 Tax=Bradyrhizobium sp. TaxID=376 RepID=UPI001D263F64|nr:Lrp/AsnC ligand binding domain-containing protein [Bradyrhizobium sp.]MBV8700305.1 Lrp/AsnC ligand binding domain-containing protein [Bradyrhizobium sp.]MBV8920110.1 Lrp/AsnC ligand binding domain-containing protein [Bradyrhizobium sp.]MBV9979490.1 Lrp/AsnC ligand binding domain-containing protein [Bradyrhizobium sp.]
MLVFCRGIRANTKSRAIVAPAFAVRMHVVVQDTQHLKDLALDQFTNRPGVTRIETSIIFDARRRYELPVFRPLR